MFPFHSWQTDTLDCILRHHNQVLGSLGASVVATTIVDVKEIVLTVDDASKDCGMVPSLVELLVCGKWRRERKGRKEGGKKKGRERGEGERD